MFPNCTFPGWEVNEYGALGGVETDWEKQKYWDKNLTHCLSAHHGIFISSMTQKAR